MHSGGTLRKSSRGWSSTGRAGGNAGGSAAIAASDLASKVRTGSDWERQNPEGVRDFVAWLRGRSCSQRYGGRRLGRCCVVSWRVCWGETDFSSEDNVASFPGLIDVKHASASAWADQTIERFCSLCCVGGRGGIACDRKAVPDVFHTDGEEIGETVCSRERGRPQRRRMIWMTSKNGELATATRQASVVPCGPLFIARSA